MRIQIQIKTTLIRARAEPQKAFACAYEAPNAVYLSSKTNGFCVCDTNPPKFE